MRGRFSVLAEAAALKSPQGFGEAALKARGRTASQTPIPPAPLVGAFLRSGGWGGICTF